MDKYTKIRFINKGSYGKIYLVEKKSSKRKYALKAIKLLGIDRYNKISILNEIKILLTNNNEFLLKCYDLFLHDNNLCIITDFIDNGDLDSYIKNNKNKISIFNDPKKAATDADVIFSDKVISMNDKVDKLQKLNDFKKFKINKKLMKFAKKDCIFLHCLPRGSEVDEKVFSSKQSMVWQQALNRVHVQKSILLYSFGKLR